MLTMFPVNPEHAENLKNTPMFEFLRDGFQELGISYTIEEIAEQVKSNQAQLWCVVDEERRECAAMLTEVYGQGQEKTCCVVMYAGQLGDDFALRLGAVENWAKSIGCKQVEINGRMGWKRALASSGYTPKTIKMIKKV